MDAEERTLWEGRSSQLVHFQAYVVCLLATALIITAATQFAKPQLLSGLLLPMAAWYLRWRLTRATVYSITATHLRRTTGLLRRRTRELPLAQVQTVALEYSFPLRLLGRGTLTVTSSDARLPLLVMKQVPSAARAQGLLRAGIAAAGTNELSSAEHGGADLPS